MTVKEFLALPKRLKNPRRRIRDEIERLKEQIDVEPSDYEDTSNKRCCGKLTYATREEAMASILSNRSKRSKKPFRSYQCESGNWHLTALTKKQAHKEITYQNKFVT